MDLYKIKQEIEDRVGVICSKSAFDGYSQGFCDRESEMLSKDIISGFTEELSEFLATEKTTECKVNIVNNIFIVYAKTENEAYQIQSKLKKLGFKSDLENDKVECYYVGSVVSSNDERNGMKLIQWGRDEVKKSNQFDSCLFWSKANTYRFAFFCSFVFLCYPFRFASHSCYDMPLEA